MPLPLPTGIAEANCGGAARAIAAPAKAIKTNLRIFPLLPVSPCHVLKGAPNALNRV